MRRAWAAFRAALAFLTILPVRFTSGAPTPANLADSRFAYPLVGLVLGLILAWLSSGLASLSIAPTLSAFLLVLTPVVMTGALHLDGLSDAADGMWLRGGFERRLAAMRDPQAGPFGVTAIVLVLLGKYTALLALAPHPQRALAVLIAAITGRCAIIVAAGSARYARPEGTGRILVDACHRRDALCASAVALLIGAACGRLGGLLAVAAALIATISLVALARQQLRGVTGDVLGAVVEVSELAVLFTFACAATARP
jgi:adenosylcobinamide-GDP ribazoletransferase